MFITLAKIPVKPERRDDYIRLAADAIDGSRKEAGNISYELYKSVENDGELLYVERWKDMAAIEAHRTMPHLLAFRKVQEAEQLINGEREIKIYEVKE